MAEFTLFDWLALSFTLILSVGYEWLINQSPWCTQTLNHYIQRQRYSWMNASAPRPMRMVDAQIFAGLQRGANFFASTALAAVGASFTLFTLSDDALLSLATLPFAGEISRAIWSIKVVCLLIIFAAAFLSFAWSYRLFNYATIAFGTLHEADQKPGNILRKDAMTAAKISVQASKAFNHGLRALFLAVPFVFWLASAAAFALATGLITAMMIHRQFFSATRSILVEVYSTKKK